MQRKFDVLIVGASIAGISTGLFSSLEGVNVAMVEKRKVIGVPVKCGEFIPTLENMKKMLPSSKNIEKVYSLIPGKAVAKRTNLIRFYAPSNRCFEFKFEGLVLRRDLLEQLIAEKALNRGARLYPLSLVKSIANKNGSKRALVRGPEVDGTIEAKVVVGADGFPSNTAKWMSLETGYKLNDIAFAIQKTMVDVEVEEDVVEMFSGNTYACGGYAWIIPKGEKAANVGLGVRLSCFHSTTRRPIQDYFNYFVKKHPIASRKLSKAKPINFSAKLIPVGGIVKEVYRDNVLLVGDAAGLVLAVNGSGIPTAMLSGYIAGKLISNYLNGQQSLDAYEGWLRGELGEIIERSVKYRRTADVLMGFDRLFSLVLRIIGVKGVSKVLVCESLL